jgi:hypothetical protein
MDAEERKYGSNFDSQDGIVTLGAPIHKISDFVHLRSSAFICVHLRFIPPVNGSV